MDNNCSLSIKDFGRNKYIEVSDNIYVGKGVALNTKIYRYTKFEHLINLLETSKLYISNRKNFSDKREAGVKLDLKNSFRLTPYPINNHDELLNSELSKRIEESRNICISCWTYDRLLKDYNNKSIENFLMWKSYSYNNVGIRITTTIKELLFSIQNSEKTIVANDVIYKKESADYFVNDSIFTKTEHYRHEDEFRLCMLSTEENACLPIDAEQMINTITFSPFISKQYYKVLKEFLEGRYNFLNGKIEKSKIIEY